MPKQCFHNLFLFLLLLDYSLYGQVYDDHLGAGHLNGVTISSSSNSVQAASTFNAQGLMPDPGNASKFLAQATMGFTLADINALDAAGLSTWLQNEFNKPMDSYLDKTIEWSHEKLSYMEAFYGADYLADPNFFYGVFGWTFREAWWQKYFTSDDYLRQRMALALSHIFVISAKSDLNDRGLAMADYYDILYQNAFGNYRDILASVSQHPAMGLYLSHFNNPKTNLAENINPDENYAREVMQLFTVGLYMLHNDGTQILDASGNPIPTYDNTDVKEFAKVFTGFGPSAWNHDCELNGRGQYLDCTINYWWVTWPQQIDFGIDAWSSSFVDPMVMYDDQHEPGPKYLLNGTIVPAGQSGMQDFEMAIDNLFYHPNTPPFISKRLIQYLVTSNPSPSYVSRVANVFINNGAGQRGDMKSIIRAILMDPEARLCDLAESPSYGKLKEPLLRWTHYLKALKMHNNMGYYRSDGWMEDNFLHEAILNAPSVFGFYSPNYIPNGVISDVGLVAPEFQLHNTAFAISYIHLIDYCFQGFYCYNISYPYWDEEGMFTEWWEALYSDDATMSFDLSYELTLANNHPALLDHLDLLFCHGSMGDATKQAILNALAASESEFQFNLEGKVRYAMFLVLLSPDFTVLK